MAKLNLQYSFFLVPLCVLAECAQVNERDTTPDSFTVLGKTKSAVLACAGAPNQELKQGDAVILRYYREAPMLDESRVHSKGSIPGVHRGCWAHLLIEDDRVTGVEFRPVPEAETNAQSCHDIFEPYGP